MPEQCFEEGTMIALATYLLYKRRDWLENAIQIQCIYISM